MDLFKESNILCFTTRHATLHDIDMYIHTGMSISVNIEIERGKK